MRLIQTSAPAHEPITLQEAKLYLRVDHDEDDPLILTFIQGARDWAESIMRRSLITQTWKLQMECFPVRSQSNPHAEIHLPRGKAQSVTAFTYLDTSGVSQSLTQSPAEYQWDFDDEHYGVLRPLRNQSWPTVYDDTLAPITVTYKAGFGDGGGDVPAGIRTAILYRLADLYELRGDVDSLRGTLSHAAQIMLEPYQIDHFGGSVEFIRVAEAWNTWRAEYA